jgi:integrase
MKPKMTAKEVDAITGAGKHRVSESLYLQIDPRHGGKSWVFIYRDKVSKKLRYKGLGSIRNLSLREARSLVEDYRAEIRAGLDPINSRKEAIKVERERFNKSKTFGEYVDAYIEVHGSEWKNVKHRQQWENTLKIYAASIIDMPIQDIHKDDVFSVLKPIWNTKTETASRVQRRIFKVIKFAKASGGFVGDNPAAWDECLEGRLPNPSKVKNVRTQPALPYKMASEFMGRLESMGAFTLEGGVSYKALVFIILTAARNSEAVKSRWEEIDFKEKTWTIPKERTKNGKSHSIPLPRKAIEILNLMQPRETGYIFRSQFSNSSDIRPITIAATLKVCKELRNARKNPDIYRDAEGRSITVHGFRSTFRDWAGAVSLYPRDLAEAALNHTLKDKTEAAYLRDKLLEKRRAMINEWADYCFSKTE